MRWLTFASILFAGCGARSELRLPDAAIPRDVTVSPDASDVVRHDATDTNAEAGCCDDQLNTEFEPATNCGHGNRWLFWLVVPQCSHALARIELHTGTPSSVALLDDASGRPGAVLFQGPLSSIEPGIAWRGADVVPRVDLIAGHHYWLAEQTITCSVAVDGVRPTMYGADTLEGPWNGPFDSTASNPYTYRMLAACH